MLHLEMFKPLKLLVLHLFICGKLTPYLNKEMFDPLKLQGLLLFICEITGARPGKGNIYLLEASGLFICGILEPYLDKEMFDSLKFQC